MITALVHRIRTQCSAELNLFRSQVHALTVAMNLQPDPRASSVHREEAHAWAGAVAQTPWVVAEYIGSQECPGGMVFHYALKSAEDLYRFEEVPTAL